MLPRWRCDNGHEFDDPVEESVPVTAVTALFGDTYRPAVGLLTSAQVRQAQVNKGDGNSIRPLDPDRVRRLFAWDPALAPVVEPRGYPSPEAAAQVDASAIPIAQRLIEQRYPGTDVKNRSHSNPGFDFLVTKDGQTVRYVELKSTTTSPGGFFMSDYQARFGAENAATYTLLLLASLNLSDGTCQPHWFDGDPRVHFQLRATQWRGDLS